MKELVQRSSSLPGRVKSRAAWATGLTLVALLGTAAPSFATATYDIAPVTTGVTSELTANIPVILAGVGALLALGIAVRMVRKFVKA